LQFLLQSALHNPMYNVTLFLDITNYDLWWYDWQ